MADVRAFRGFRYDLGRAGTLSDLVAPPYDVVDADLQRRLHDRSPYNALRLELATDEPGDTPTRNKYTRAGQTLSGWMNDGVVRQDTLRTLYVVEQEFTVEGTTHKRRGFIARVRLEPFGTGRIFPHEETMSGPKEDRLKLLKATSMNLSPIFGLYPDQSNSVFQHLDPLMKQLPLEATDHLGVVSRLWPVTDERVIGMVLSGMADKPVFIADGHHRYETALKHLAESPSANDEAPGNFVMMMLVSMGDPGLVILPTHRLFRGFPGLTANALKAKLEPHFDVDRYPSAQDCWSEIELEAMHGEPSLALHTQTDGVWQMVRLKDHSLMEQLAATHSEPWRKLGVSILHVAAVDKLLGGHSGCQYVHLLSEVESAIAAGSCDLAALVPPATMGDVETIAGSREKMPPKSTYFYPKLLTGLVFNSVKTH